MSLAVLASQLPRTYTRIVYILLQLLIRPLHKSKRKQQLVSTTFFSDHKVTFIFAFSGCSYVVVVYCFDFAGHRESFSFFQFSVGCTEYMY